VATVRACLVDVYETLIAYDFQARFRTIAALARVDLDDLRRSQQQYRLNWTQGRCPPLRRSAAASPRAGPARPRNSSPPWRTRAA
jgi:hypothetical protein